MSGFGFRVCDRIWDGKGFLGLGSRMKWENDVYALHAWSFSGILVCRVGDVTFRVSGIRVWGVE